VDRALALEDSLTGFRSTVAAGLGCVICPDYFIAKPDNAFSEADLVVDSLLELSANRLQQVHALRHNPAFD